ncbi:hypothetical protein [Phocaeicola coprocola]|jgi:hypothetical protein|uniref:hypothetical protein n=1 Tax=Phocaeicola coprocola TaxID=310298 RepID=UPI0022E687D0|nr:hypothetical protein [Phocaeicola coprocola]
MAVPVQLEIFMKDLTKAGLQSVGKNVDDVENQTLQLISALKQVIAEQKHQLEVNKAAGLSYTQEAANIQALTGQVRRLETGLNSLKKTKEETAKTQTIDIDTEAVTRKANNLKMQFSQVARELPSLAMGPQMFILAISNNLPMLADAIADVRKQNELLAASGQKGVPVWKQLAGAVFSWQTALVAAISLGIVFGKDIANWVKELINGKKAIDNNKEALENYKKAMLDSQQAAQEEIVQLNLLYQAAVDSSKGMNERISAVKELKKEFPQYFKNLSDEEVLVGKAADKYNELATAIMASAKAQAAKETLIKNSKEILDLESKITEEYKKQELNEVKRTEAVGKLKEGQNRTFLPVSNDVIDAVNRDYDRFFNQSEEKITEWRKKIYDLTKFNKSLEDQVNIEDLLFESNGGGGETGTGSGKTDYASQLADARVKAQQTTEKLRIQIMQEGIAKRKALAKQEYDEQLADIDKQERDTIAKMDKARKQGDNIPQSQYDEVKTEADEQRLLAEKILAEKIYQINKEYLDKTLDAEIEYNKQYGTWQEKREAVALEYTKKIALAQTEAEKKLLKEKGKEAVAAVDFEEFKESINWELIFGNLDKVAKQELQKLRAQLEQFRQSPEYKNMAIDERKVLDEALNEIQQNIIEKGGLLGNLPEQLQVLAEAQNELEKAQSEYNKSLILGTEAEKEAALKKRNQAQANVVNAQANVNAAADLTGQRFSKVTDSMIRLSEARSDLSQLGNSIGTLIDAFSDADSKIGGIVGSIIGVLEQLGDQGISGFVGGILENVSNLAGHMWDTIGSFFGVKGLGGIFYGADYSEYENMKSQYETLSDIWDELIDKKQQYIDISYGEEAEKAYQESVNLLNQKMQQAYALAEARKSAGSSMGSHSIAYRQNRDLGGYASELYKYVNQNGNYNDITNALLGASADQLRNVRDNMWAFWAGLDAEFRNALEQIIACDDQIDDLGEKMNEVMTGVDFSSFQNSFVDMLNDLDSTSQDFADNFEKYLQNAVFSSLIANKYKSRIEALYKDWTEKADGGLTTDEVNKLRQDYQNIINDMLAEREQIMNSFGWESSSSGSSQSPGSGALTTMSQDSISTFEAIGRNMQTHLANTDKFVQEIRNTQKLDSQTLATIASHTAYIVLIYDLMEDLKLNGIQLK